MERAIRHVCVIDIGKTNLKVAVVDLQDRVEIGVLKRQNTVLAGPPYPHYDIDGHWTFICDAIARLNGEHGIDAISVTTHGASLVLLDRHGDLAAPVLDYEHDGPDSLAGAYDRIRSDFGETGSPRLPLGLNAGAQLFWQFKTDPGLQARVATILTYPQYWTYRLTGVLANEVTSLGCHTDLWDPRQGRFSSLVTRLGIADRMAPVMKAIDCAGPLKPGLAEAMGVSPATKVACGIHDSNASLLPHLLERTAPFSVVSTGTWVIALAIGGEQRELDPKRDTLINVNAFGDPVPSARFMGGREFDMVMNRSAAACTEAEADAVLQRQVMLLPAVEPRSGPFQGHTATWTVDEAELTAGERFAALSCYLALVTAECLSMIGARGPTIVEGPFSRNRPYLAMLEAATGRPAEVLNASATGTSIGAALLVPGAGRTSAGGQEAAARCPQADPARKAYAAAWRKQVPGP